MSNETPETTPGGEPPEPANGFIKWTQSGQIRFSLTLIGSGLYLIVKDVHAIFIDKEFHRLTQSDFILLAGALLQTSGGMVWWFRRVMRPSGPPIRPGVLGKIAPKLFKGNPK